MKKDSKKPSLTDDLTYDWTCDLRSDLRSDQKEKKSQDQDVEKKKNTDNKKTADMMFSKKDIRQLFLFSELLKTKEF